MEVQQNELGRIDDKGTAHPQKDFWEENIKPLIDKRNVILDAHDNSMEAFDLPEIKEIDAEIDRLELFHGTTIQIPDYELELIKSKILNKVLIECLKVYDSST